MADEDLLDFVEKHREAPGATNAPTDLGTPAQYPPPEVPLDFQQASKAITGLGEERRRQYISQTQQPGVPLDISSGASPWERFWVGSMRDRDDALAYMQNKYGADNVRLDQQGDFVFRAPDKSGKLKDIKFDPENLTVGDLAQVASVAPEVLGAVGGVMLARKAPRIGTSPAGSQVTAMKRFWDLTRDVLAGAAGGESVGAAKDVTMHELERGRADIGETLAERAKMAGTDVAMGYGTYGLGRFFKFMGAPFSGSRGPVQFKGREAQEYFANDPRYLEKVPLSASETSGNPLIGRTEVYTELQPGGYGPLKQLKEKQEQSLLKLQNIMMGTPPASEQVASGMESALGMALEPSETAVKQATEALRKGATGQIEDVATQLTTPQKQLYREATGNQVRNKVVSLADAARSKAEQAYEDARKIHGVQDKAFDGTGLQARFKQIVSELPTVETTKTVPIGLAGPTGAPLTRTVTRKELLEQWPPSKLLPRLQEFISKKNPKVSYWDLKNMRRDVYDDLTKSEAVPDMGAHYLSEIGKALTDEMEKIKASLPPGGFKTAIEKADTIWKNEVLPFDRPGIKELFRREGETGFVTDDEVISRLFTRAPSPSITLQNWNLMRETLGANSPEFTNIKRALVDHIIEGSREVGEQFINPADLTRTLTDLRVKYPAIADEVFGPRLNEFFRQAKFLEYGKNPKISNEDLQALLRDPSPTAAKLQDLVNKQKVLSDTYRNDILKQVKANQLPETAINPKDFVSLFIDNPKTSKQDIQQVMSMLQRQSGTGPLIEDIQSKVVENILQKSGRRFSVQDLSRLFAGQKTQVASGSGLLKVLNAEPETTDKLRLILGPQKFEDLRQYANLIAATEYKYASSGYAMAGAFAASGTVKHLEQLEFLKFAKAATANWVVAKLITSAPLRYWVNRLPANPDPGYIYLFFSSPVFLREVAKDMTEKEAPAFIANLKNAMDQWLKVKSTQTQGTADADYNMRKRAMDQFLNQQRSVPQ